MLKQILSLSHEAILNIIQKAITPHVSLLPAVCFATMFQMYSIIARWSTMQADLLGLILQMLDWKSLLSVSSVSKYYHLQVLKPNNWKYVTIVFRGKATYVSETFFRCAVRSLRFVRSLNVEECGLTECTVMKLLSSWSLLRNLSLICIAAGAIGPSLIRKLIRCCPLLESLQLEQYARDGYAGN
jgi:hypothetical protein